MCQKAAKKHQHHQKINEFLQTFIPPQHTKALVTLFKTRPAENLAEKQVGLPVVSPGRPWAAP